MTHTELTRLRLSMKCSMSELARALNIPKSTYARYEDNSSKVPEVIAEQVEWLHKKLTIFSDQLTEILNNHIDRQFPHGIMSAPQRGE